MIVVDVCDQNVGQTIIVEVGDDRLTRFTGTAIAALPIESGRLRRVGEVTFAVVEVERVARSAEHEHVDVAVVVDVFRGNAGAAECRRHLQDGSVAFLDGVAADHPREPVGHSMLELNAACAGDVGEERAVRFRGALRWR